MLHLNIGHHVCLWENKDKRNAVRKTVFDCNGMPSNSPPHLSITDVDQATFHSPSFQGSTRVLGLMIEDWSVEWSRISSHSQGTQFFSFASAMAAEWYVTNEKWTDELAEEMSWTTNPKLNDLCTQQRAAYNGLFCVFHTAVRAHFQATPQWACCPFTPQCFDLYGSNRVPTKTSSSALT